nr:MAG TPA: hypothetical protein [Caudoviricetes sp.]
MHLNDRRWRLSCFHAGKKKTGVRLCKPHREK